jgi:hypothetical protein
MTTTPFIHSTHSATNAAHSGSGPARRTRQFVAAPVAHSPAPLQNAPITENDPLSTADAVLELLRSVNRNRVH